MKRSILVALRAMRRSPYQALVAIVMAMFSFFVAVSFVSLLYIAGRTISYMESRPQVIGYFAKNIEDERMTSIAKDLESRSYVSFVKLVSKQDALALFQEENAKDPLLSSLVTSDMLPASIEVSAKSAIDLDRISAELGQTPGIEEVTYQKDTVATWNKWSAVLRQTGSICTLFLLTLTLLLIFVIIGLRVSTNRKEIGIMNILGASRWYIRGPFVFEGMIYGFVGSMFGWLSSFTALLYMTPTIVSFFQSIPILPIPTHLILLSLLCSLSGGIAIGFLSSFLAVTRFIR